jgi:Initiator Rep protein, WH2/Initiator Replication protein, WH1
MIDPNSPQLPLALIQRPKPTGDIWQPSKTHPATVPVPLPVVMVRVDGPFTALDRKLWLVLLHHAWDELDSDKPFHEISIAEIVRLFRRFGRTDLGSKGKIAFGKTEEETDAAMLWDSIRRLVKTSVEWEDEDYQSISHLINEAMLNKKYRETGKLYYSFGRMLSKNILAPRAFARLRCHVVLALRSKYAVTLYEILEAYVNRRESSLTVSIEELRSWLKVPEDAYKDWKDLKRNVVLPAVDEINQHGAEGGFFVSYEGVREGKSFAKIRFTLAKTADRDDRDMKLQGKARRGRAFKATASPAAAGTPYEPTDAVLDQLLTLAPGWDRQGLVARYRQWSKGKEAPDNPHGAFLGWVKRFTKGKAPS